MKNSELSTSNLHVFKRPEIKASPSKSDKPQVDKRPAPASHIDPSVLSFALNNSGLSVQTLAKEANRSGSENEVIIKLH